MFPVCCSSSYRDLLCLEIEGLDYLAMGCISCGINLFDHNGKNQTLIKAFSDSPVLAMCEGKNNTLYVIHGDRVVELDCSTTNFKRKRSMYRCPDSRFSSLCYIPFQDRLIVLANLDEKRMLAISCESGQLLWSLPVEEYMLFQYLPEHKGLLGYKRFGATELSVICPETGVCTQKIPLPCDICVKDMLVSKGSLFILGLSVDDDESSDDSFDDEIAESESFDDEIAEIESFDDENERIRCIVFRVKCLLYCTQNIVV